ncbi:predicted protein [Naegleria gruberi]|uniref:Predicted protein n=1 Tax=Naegleria gruberi TaxID=5762 RepID=D2VDD9_NAEGR|nr:uncharacterized protein NAEGRDRAFT_66808 [Naegleria gruberi]EFC45126.1 predicted protein [Naegleria gruberi]|eukprot:XP_002677870.1 predicted protein [Naegleria gruberi strain NEG-M]
MNIPRPQQQSSLLTESLLSSSVPSHQYMNSSVLSSSVSNNLSSNLIKHTPHNPLLMSSQVMKTYQDVFKDEKIKKQQQELVEKNEQISKLVSQIDSMEDQYSTAQTKHERDLQDLEIRLRKEYEEREEELKKSHEAKLAALNEERKNEFETSQQKIIEQEYLIKDIQSQLNLTDSKDIVKTLTKFIKKYKKEKEANKSLEERGKQMLANLNDVVKKYKESKESAEKEFDKKNREIEGQKKEIMTLRMELAVVQRQLEYNRTHMGVGFDTDTEDGSSLFNPSSPTTSVSSFSVSSPSKSPSKALTPKKMFGMPQKKTITLSPNPLKDITNLSH